MAQDYSPSLVTNGLAFCGDAAVPSTAAPPTNIGGAIACRLYDRVSDNNGTMYNANCVDFDGTDAYVTYGDVTWLDGLTTISVCCWLSQDGSPPGTGGVFLSKDNAIECWTRYSGTDRYTLSINNNHKVFSGASTPATGEWVHVVMTWNSTGDVRKLYLNGGLVDTNTSGSQSGNSINNTAQDLAIGARASSAYEIDGKMADVKIFNAELSAANVKEIYDDSKVIIPTKNDASGGFLSQSDLTLWAPLAEGVGYVAYDGSGYGRDGTYSATDWLTGQTGCPQLVEGYNRPMWFENSEEVVVGSKAAINFIGTDNFSLSAWVWLKTNSSFDHIIGKSYDDFRLCANGTQLSFRTNSNNVIAAGGTMGTKQWYHVVGTWATDGSGGGTAKAYINGAEVGSATGSYSWTSTGNSFKIGNSSTESYYWQGLINECIAYNKTLSLAEVRVLAARANTSYSDTSRGPLPPNPMALSDSANVVGYWRNDGDVTWTDRSSNSNDGAVAGSPDVLFFKQGYNGQKNVNTGRDGQGFPLRFKNVGAIGFNGSTDYTKVLAQSVPELDDIFDGGGTASAWIYAASDGETSYGRILHKRSAGLGWFIECRDESGGFIRIRFQQEFNTTDGQWQTAVDVPINQWVYVCVTYDSDSVSNDATIYINGVSSSSEEKTPVGTRGTDDAQHLYIGNRGANDYTFDGQIANAQLYNRALTYAEIQQNYKSFKARFGK